MLTECAAEGLRLLNAHFQQYSTPSFFNGQFLPIQDGFVGRYENRLDIGNPDLFYSCLSVLHATEDEHLLDQILGQQEAKTALEQSLDFMEKTLYQESQFERDLRQSILSHTSLSDDQIRHEFLSRFEVETINMMDLPTDKSIYFAKVNHGYWEYMRTAYDDLHAQRAQSEELNLKNVPMKKRRLRVSGVTQFWGRQIQRQFMHERVSSRDKEVPFCISLVAGTEPPASSLRRELGSVTRGAAIGMLSLFDAAVPGRSPYQVGDGGAPRFLIINQTLEDFFDKYIADSEACLFVVPPHLKQVDFVNYKGRVYKFLVPPTRINENWKAVAATLLGYLTRLGEKHQSITVLAQGASIASLMALLFADVDALPKIRLRYFDLGRVLDVAAPEFLRKQGWAAQQADKYIAEGRKVFCASEGGGFKLASHV